MSQNKKEGSESGLEGVLKPEFPVSDVTGNCGLNDYDGGRREGKR